MVHKMQGISSLTQQLLDSQKRFSSMVLLLCIKSTEFMNVYNLKIKEGLFKKKKSK